MRSTGGSYQPVEGSFTKGTGGPFQRTNGKRGTESLTKNSSDKRPDNPQLRGDHRACLHNLVHQAHTSPRPRSARAVSDPGRMMGSRIPESVSRNQQQSVVALALHLLIRGCRAHPLHLKRFLKTHFNKCQTPTILRRSSAQSLRITANQDQTQLDWG